jgi:HTH-type transcriptional regulator/antitoxin HipB
MIGEKVIYPIKTLSQLPLILKSFRKEKGLTQAAIAERLGITQQSYAYFEANPAAATLERLFLVLRMLDVEISLDQTSPAPSGGTMPSVKAPSKRTFTVKTIGQKIGKIPSTVAKRKVKPSAVVKASPVVAPTRKKESW